MRYLLLVLPMMLCIGCESVGPDESTNGDLILSTERQNYTAGAEATAVVKNSSDAPLYLYQCGGEIALLLQMRHGGEWETVTGVNHLCTHNKTQSPFQFDAGEQKGETFSLDHIGEYRLRTEYGDESDFDSYEKETVSETFEIVDP